MLSLPELLLVFCSWSNSKRVGEGYQELILVCIYLPLPPPAGSAEITYLC